MHQDANSISHNLTYFCSKLFPWDITQTHRSRHRSGCECDCKGWIWTVVITEPGFPLLIVIPVHSWGEKPNTQGFICSLNLTAVGYGSIIVWITWEGDVSKQRGTPASPQWPQALAVHRWPDHSAQLSVRLFFRLKLCADQLQGAYYCDRAHWHTHKTQVKQSTLWYRK